ncbi:metal-dependent hydrolase family protein [Photobacterium atrarenae]|uniref:Amidohydrolase family protein n=1 Tax=Photobacterium atrarenae TaxID=865757 RepID=A0ABY5GMR5_9GAMM|nr:amidohydrolase family protein [Photobacterium atrarenae]UTV30542.1 amidohydrolase family protein [Photobacterium atrarenae]
MNLCIKLLLLSLALSLSSAFAGDKPLKILITNVHIFDGVSEERLMNSNVLIEDHLIKQISNQPILVDDAIQIDGKARTLIPGLIDMHWHSAYASIPMNVGLTSDHAYHLLIGAKSNEKALLRGFTTVRDVGGNVFSLAKLTDTGVYDGPRIFPSGPAISQTSGHTDFRPSTAVPADLDAPLVYMERIGHVIVADGVPEVLKRTREALRMGATQIKINSGGGVSSSFDPLDVTQFTIEETKAAVDAAKDWNTYVATHTFTDAATRRAVEAGVLSIEHGHLLSEETLRLMKEKGAYLSMQPILDDEDAIPFPEGSFSRMKYIAVTKGTDRVYQLAKKIGVKTVFGTDTLFDPELAEKQGKQLAKLARWYTPVEVLRQATSTAGELLARSGPRNPYPEGPLGVIKQGAYADLILVDGNPLENIDLVANPQENFDLIMKNGKIYKNELN